MRLRTGLALGIAAAALTACAKEGDTIPQRLFPLMRAAILPDEPLDVGRTVDPTREQLNQIPSATIGFSYGELDPVYMIPLSDNGGYLTFQDVGQRGVVLFGGGVAGSEGLGNDLYAVKHAQNDPVAHRTPLAEWPRAVARSYQYRVRDLDDYIITVACEFTPIRRVYYEIVELRYNVTRVEETCRNARREFQNTYWVDDSGFIWASEQWLGPDLDTAAIEIIRPYGG